MLMRYVVDPLPYTLPFFGGYAVYRAATDHHAQLCRKNPKDFENDV